LKTAEERDLVVAVLRLLADVGRPAHLPSLRALVTSHDGVVRAQALRALGRLGGEGDLPALVNALDDEFTWAALYAARGVRESGGRGILLDAAASESRRGRLALQVLEEEGAW
jgi:HEAT repeat protein